MTAEQLARRYQRRAQIVEQEFAKTSRGLAISAVKFCREKLTELIYSQPIPKRPKSGKPMWRRTGLLRRSEQADTPDAYTVRVTNTAAYAEPRHEAGKPGRRATRYPAHWRDELVKTFRSIVTEAHARTWRDILKRG